ncbi:MAG: 2-oxo-4-hydroxy-4-carboxy-5-ureidoimidazoline decarboxylase [Pseudomonadota bacterium]
MKHFSLNEFNLASEKEAKEALQFCCGSSVWANQMTASRPLASLKELKEKSSLIWNSLSEADWKEAFSHHPTIGDLESLKKKFASTKAWAQQEQKGSVEASPSVLQALATLNKTYENRFGFIFIVCATGKTAQEMLELLETRMKNSPHVELRNAAKEQEKITHLRLEKMIYE